MYLIDTRKYDDSFLLAKILEKVDFSDEEKKKLFKHFEKPEAVDAETVRHGHWTNIKISVTGNSSAECSLCGTVVHDTFADVDRLNYCPHCGAKMDPVEEYAYVDPDIYPCRICEDYDGKGGCMSKGGCGQRREDVRSNDR